MKPKFKIGDVVKFHARGYGPQYVQITLVSDIGYYYVSISENNFFSYEASSEKLSFENGDINYGPAEYLTPEEKLEIL